jgi:arabinose-5-phosphate isomerase
MIAKTDFRDLEKFGKSVLQNEIQAMQALRKELDYQVLQAALNLILSCEGMILIAGSGTSSTIARRLAHTLTCSNLPAYFLDPGQCIHGYSAILRNRDILINFSRGGETDEVNFLAEVAREKGAIVISILENDKSTLANLSDIAITASVCLENESIETIPLSHTIIQAAVGDILCAAINQIKEFDPEEFIKFHPGGAVGKQNNH